ncbi:MAG: alpha-ribazole phosphatase [Desulfatibacillaceae bacterium]
MNIYLVRHTAVAVEMGTFYGHTDVDLADTFRQEVRSVLKKLPDNPDAVYSSPSTRCVRLASRIDPDPVLDPRIMELNFGQWEMRTWRDIPRDVIEPWYADYVNQSCPEGESFGVMFARVVEFFEELRARKHQTAVVVCHGGVVRSFLVHVLGMPLNRAYAMHIDFGGVSRIVCDGTGANVRYVNR